MPVRLPAHSHSDRQPAAANGDPDSAHPSRHVRLLMQSICKSFGPTPALTGVGLSVQAGAVHALIGRHVCDRIE